jgi:hypothetical protein
MKTAAMIVWGLVHMILGATIPAIIIMGADKTRLDPITVGLVMLVVLGTDAAFFFVLAGGR